MRVRIRIRIQEFCQCGSGSGSGSRPRVLMTKNLKMFTAEFFFIYFMDKNCNFYKPKPPLRTSKLQEILQPSKENIQHFKTWIFFFYFWGSFLPSWIRIRIRIRTPKADPDFASSRPNQQKSLITGDFYKKKVICSYPPWVHRAHTFRFLKLLS